MVKVYAEPDGMWAITADGLLARFEDDRLVEQLDLGGIAVTGPQWV